MADRRNRDRDSGINNPDDETLGEIERLNAIGEEQFEDPEDPPLHTAPEDLPKPYLHPEYYPDS